MQDLRDFLENNELIDLNLKENRSIWSNRKIGKGFILIRLDQMLASYDQVNQYQNYTLTSLPRISSDHRPIALSMELMKKIKCPLKFENMWMKLKYFKDKLFEW